jgi:formylglycine-generating enzyme required for sulfatase activity
VEGSYRVIRGGSWFNVADDCRSAFLDHCHPTVRNAIMGFRLSRKV